MLPAQSTNLFIGNRSFTDSTCRNPNNIFTMDQPFDEMAKGVPKADAPTEAAAPKQEEQVLPKLSPQEFKMYNRMAEHMDMFVSPPWQSRSIRGGPPVLMNHVPQHEHFRETWNTLHTACTSSKRPPGMSIRTFLSTAAQFCQQLTFHHTIEEQHIFPILARKMPAFQKELQLLTQHKEIHKGLDELEKYLGECRSGERELRLEEMGRIMDSFGKVLWTHLDEEVYELRAENMRRFWTPEEMRRIPI
ncbi:hypothetical protein LTR62_001323 [Meristemomyces frigidus]|uniref:Hemerythrin-like domain-containing protein n=1 Tax=Meristemomyces frigidus TaxID=1508187 RepID=A0AAN7TJU3_9PEZI|nr:hypothetical protein LTR62_001323 [Meristemomyces frigidus]